LPIISFPHYDGNSEVKEGHQWDDFINKFEPQKENYYPKADDVWTIIFTSGTTGDSKGAVIKYESLMNTREIHEAFNPLGIDTSGNNRFISYLPLNHIFERICIEWTCLRYGGSISFVESLETFGQNLQDVEPTTFAGVPRIYTKFQEKILAKMSQKKLNILLKIPFVSSIIKKKLRAALGWTKVRVIVSGAAAMPNSLLNWYKSIGVYIINGYGMTENCCVCTNLDPFQPLGVGSVGKVSSPSVDLKITDEGEVCMTGPFLMDSYFKNEEMTKETLKDGWLHTGDMGYIDENGFLYITGRVKDIFKTSKGKYIEPSVLESYFGKITDFQQMCIVGLGLDQPILLAVPSEKAKTNKEDFNKKMSNYLSEVNKDLDGYKKIKKIVMVKEEWLPENGLSTPTLKIKRAKIDQRFSENYQEWYNSTEEVLWE
jgi:long-subunit acyl-CoA synthetase (AMP-forming)